MSTSISEPAGILERLAFEEFDTVYSQFLDGEADFEDVAAHEEALELASELNSE